MERGRARVSASPRPRVSASHLLLLALCATTLAAAEPDYSGWDSILSKYYDPVRGMNYRALKANDAATLRNLRQRLATVDVNSLTRKQQLAYWINLYNVNVVGIVVDHYPVRSIRDISTDPIRRLNVFERDLVPFGSGRIALDAIEHERIRKGFQDPRIHFAINCAAKSCPPMARQAMRGARVGAQLEALTRQFLNGPLGVRIERKRDFTVIHTTRIMEWFGDDFEKWGGGTVDFIRRYLPASKRRLLIPPVRLDFDPYDWTLNDRR